MANKRMFTKHVTESDAFLDMPASAQCLYFHLNMNADDDGFIGNPRRVMRFIGCASEDDMKLLVAKRFLIPFDDGVIVIKHWRMHNALSRSRYTETVYSDKKAILKLKDNGAYSLNSGTPLTVERQRSANGAPMERLERELDIDIDKDIDRESIGESMRGESPSPSVAFDDALSEALEDYFQMRKRMNKGKDISSMSKNAVRSELIALATDECKKPLDSALAIQILKQSTANEWKTLFLPKKATQKGRRNGFKNFEERNDDFDPVICNPVLREQKEGNCNAD